MKITVPAIFSIIIPLIFAIACIVILAGCGIDDQGKGPAQRAGEATGKAVDGTADAIKQGADKAGEVLEEGAQKTGAAVERVGEKIKDATQ